MQISFYRSAKTDEESVDANESTERNERELRRGRYDYLSYKFVITSRISGEVRECIAHLFVGFQHADIAEEILSQTPGAHFEGAGDYGGGRELNPVWRSQTCRARFKYIMPPDFQRASDMLEDLRLSLLALKEAQE